jgi:hypothetical protein
LSDADEDDLVAVLKTLTDGYQPDLLAEPGGPVPIPNAETPPRFTGARDVIRVLRFVEHKRIADREDASKSRR